MITTINPKIALSLALFSLFGLFYNMYYEMASYVTFSIGVILALPVSIKTWFVIKKHWKTVYKKFYSLSLFERKMIALKSWKLTWWIVPYCLVAYSIITVLIIHYSNNVYLLESLLLGSVFTVFMVTYHESPRYYKTIRRRK